MNDWFKRTLGLTAGGLFVLIAVNGEKFTVLRTMPDPFTIYGKKVRLPACWLKY